MEVNTHQNLRDDPLSDCPSFGSAYNPLSQSRKISIGIMVDSSANRTSRPTKEQGVAVLNGEVDVRNAEKPIQRKKMDEETTKKAEAPQQQHSPWISTGLLFQDNPIPETVKGTNRVVNSPASSRGQNKVHGVKVAPATYSVHSFANETSKLKSGDIKKKKLDGTKNIMKGGKSETSEKLEKFAFATKRGFMQSDKAETEDKTEKSKTQRTETLRMRLHGILGTVSSPKHQNSESRNCEHNANELRSDQNLDYGAIKCRQGSDTIEMDSESPNQTVKRPVTRSLTRKRAPTKVKPNKTRNGGLSSYKVGEDENIVNFEEGWPGRLITSQYGDLSMSTRKKNEKRSFRIQPRKISFQEKDKENAGEAGQIETLVRPGKRSSQEQDFHKSPLINKFRRPPEDFNNAADAGQQEGMGNASSWNALDPDHLESPTLRINTPVSPSPPISRREKNETVRSLTSTGLRDTRFVVEDTFAFKKFQTSREYFNGTSARSQSPDDMDQHKESPTMKATTNLSEREEDGLSEAAIEERGADSFEEDCPSSDDGDGSKQRWTFSPEIGTSEKLKSTLYSTKRHRIYEENRFSYNKKPAHFHAGTGESTRIEEALEDIHEDALERAVKLFALELQKVKSKIKSVTIKKSSEIMMSVAEMIHFQLQNVESKIQTDVGKLKNVGKAKRKQLEMRFLEEQEQLKLIHEKFREEVSQHLQNCGSTLEELEAEQNEFKGIVEKQKAAYRETLVQVEESVGAQLSDAQSRMTAMNELAREKMLQLRNAMTLCLEDGMLT